MIDIVIGVIATCRLIEDGELGIILAIDVIVSSSGGEVELLPSKIC